MARIPDEQIERLKQEISLMRLVERQGITLKKHGKDYLGFVSTLESLRVSLSIS